jgi:hypothetical protein
MKIPNKLRKAFLATSASLILTACGGGGSGGGAPGAVSNFVDSDLSSLSGASSIVSNWSRVLSSFQATNSSTNMASLMSVLTGPDAEDKATANSLLTQLATAESLWADTETLIASKSDSEKFGIYNGDAYKEAYAAMLYLKNHVKPVIQQVANGQAISLDQMNSVVKADRAQTVIDQEKTTTAVSYAETKKVKSTTARNSNTETYNQVETGSPISDLSGEAATWAPISGGGGRETRTIVVTTPQTRVVRTESCTWTDVVKLTATGTTTTKVNETCSTAEVKTDLSPTVANVVQEQEGSNPITNTEILADAVTDAVTEWNSAYGTNGVLTTTSVTNTVANTPEVVAGSESTATVNYTKNRTTATGTRNQVNAIVDNWRKTTVTRPIVTTPSNNVTYTDVGTKQKRTWTITTNRTRLTYRDGTTEIVETVQPKVYTDWATIQVSSATRTVREEGTPVNGFNAPGITDVFVSQASSTVRSNAYTDNDADLGTKTTGLSTTAANEL